MSMPAVIDRSSIERIVREIVVGAITSQANGSRPSAADLVVSISARHLHLR
jgi:hypothetical protein